MPLGPSSFAIPLVNVVTAPLEEAYKEDPPPPPSPVAREDRFMI